MEWSDLKVFLAMADAGSVRAAAQKLDVSHSTVSRRICALEKDLGVRLFDRLPGGYRLTAEGREVFFELQEVEDKVHALQRRILGKDSKLSGPLKVTMPDILASTLLMQDIVSFTRKYPEIELDVVATYDALSLNNREADVAIRITNRPPGDLVGRKVTTYARANYAARGYIKKIGLENLAKQASWIGWDDVDSHPDWVKNSPYPALPTRHHLNNPLLQLSAVREGLGIGMLPCFMADQYPDVQRVPDTRCEEAYQTWLFTHRDLRYTSRVRVFMAAMVEAFERSRPLLQGYTYRAG